jgi:dihydrofolate reductase
MAMRKVIVSEFLTVDGVMQAPGHTDEDRRRGFEHGGWQMGYIDEVGGKAITEGITQSGGLMLGRRTYELFAAYWPSASAEEPLAGIMNSLPKFVASRTLKEPLEWENSTLLKGDLVEEVTKLKEQSGGDLLVIGSGDLVQSLMQQDLVDQYQLMIHPLVLGSGMQLFREGSPKTALRLADTKTTDTGVVFLTYEPTGGNVEYRP